MDDTLRVGGLWVYPVKSLGGCALGEAELGPLGLAGDRRWTLVADGGAAAGVALTQRERPTMALLRAAPAGDGVVVTDAAGAALRIEPAGATAARTRVSIFGDVLDAATYAPDVDRWFSERLGTRCRLVHLPTDSARQVDVRYAAPGDRTAFTDGYPVLVASRASLDDLNARLAARGEPAVTIERFRPNLLVDGGRAWQEDGWSRLRLGEGAELALVKPCARCVVTTVDPLTAAVGREPLRTLADLRRRDGRVLFAENAVVRAGGRVRVGDLVTTEPRALGARGSVVARSR